MKVDREALLEKLRAEKSELDERIEKLGRVLHSTDAECAIRLQISDHHFDLLELQYSAMLVYSQALNMRICDLIRDKGKGRKG